jgi:hypothetical protein
MNEILRHISGNVTRNCLMFIITQVPHVTHTQVHLTQVNQLFVVLTVINISNTLIKHNGMDTLKIKSLSLRSIL